MKRLIATLFVFGGVAVASAAILLHESFDYINGPLVTVGGTNWQTISGTAGQIAVVNSRASLNLADSEDAHAFLSPAPSTDVVYAGFTLRFSKLPSSSGSYFAMFKGAGVSTDFRARIWALTNGVSGGRFRLGLSSTLGTLNVTNPTELFLNTDYRVVVRLWNATGEASLWVDPLSEADLPITTVESPSSSAVAAFALRQASSPGQLTLDDLVVGESFDEVVSNNYVPPSPALPAPGVSVLDYNVHGNSIADWTTNSPQVQAIGRQVAFLDPDIITFQELPMTNNGWANLPSFVDAFCPGFFLATNSSDDGYIRSAILSRYPIARSESWLHWADLKPFGYTNTINSLADNFTRDLFEAEIVVPAFDQPLHVFTAHLKSGSGDDAQKRAAEASAISNFFVNVFLPSHGQRPYLLTGDLNEDIADPSVDTLPPIQRLVNAATGLQLTTPRNPVTGEWRTHSIRNTNGLASRYDYILPGRLLQTNYAEAQIFRTDVLDPLPSGLFSNDCRTASDHLPVLMYFANPYGGSFRLLSLEALGGSVTLLWESASNRVYNVQVSSNLTEWTTLASNLTATGTNLAFTTNASSAVQFFRVLRQP